MTTASHFSLLVVDDEPDLRTLYELTLLREGYDLDTAGSVQEALLHLKDRTYSAVITDMRLPDGSGLDVLHWLEENGVRFAPGGIRKGAAGHDVCFIHPKGNESAPIGGEGVLIELVQAPPDVIEAHRRAGAPA